MGNTQQTLFKLFAYALLIASALSGCASQTVKSTDVVEVLREENIIDERYLLDVSIQVFDPGLDREVDETEMIIFPEIRRAEAHYIPQKILESFQESAGWGAVRLVPNETSAADVLVSGEILVSDGETMSIKVKVEDASGREWFERKYTHITSKYAYERTPGRAFAAQDPFQNIYNKVANDVLVHRKKLKNKQLAEIRSISQMRFAQSFAPDAFDGYVVEDKKGRYKVVRLPAENDPMLRRIDRIRERDYLFVDTLQVYYNNLVRTMDSAYQEWRKASYDEVIELDRLKRKARAEKIAGLAAVIGGIAAQTQGNRATRTAGQVGVIGGVALVRSGFARSEQAALNVSALQELGDSLEAEIAPQIIEMEDRTITLTGTVENQYDQWRDILRDIYEADTQTATNNE